MHSMISAIICTWNRSGILLRCLRSLETQTLSKDRYEVVVVDNNSTDGTDEAVAAHAKVSPMRTRYVREPRQGLSNARNAGIEVAHGDILVFLDDDCTAEPGFLSALVNAFDATGASLIAGKVTSVPPDGLVTNLPEGFDATKKLANLDLGPQRRTMLPHEYALGGNLAVTKKLAEEIGGFKESLGYAGESKIVGEDTEFCDRARAWGALSVWEPHAAVLHRVGPERFTKAAVRNAAYCYGQGSMGRRLGKNPLLSMRIRAAVTALLSLPICAIAWILLSWSLRYRFEVSLKAMSALGKLSAALGRSRR